MLDVVEHGIPADVVLDLLEGRPFRDQPAVQCAGMHVEFGRNRFIRAMPGAEKLDDPTTDLHRERR